jgi:predicted nucleotidyltransferase
MTFENIIKEIEKVCRENNVKHLYLFGSYAKGNNHKGSDIDIVVKGVDNIVKLKEDIDNIKTLETIDVFNYEMCKSPFLREDIDKYGKIIY